jgi:hypothetical protein
MCLREGEGKREEMEARKRSGGKEEEAIPVA